MTDLDMKLAAVSAITGRNPTRVPNGSTLRGVDCIGLTCTPSCPFFRLNYGCIAPDPGESVYDGSIRTYKEALAIIATHPELLL